MHVKFVLRMLDSRWADLYRSAPWVNLDSSLRFNRDEILVPGYFIAVNVCDLCHKIVFLNTYGTFSDFSLSLWDVPTYSGASGCTGCSRFSDPGNCPTGDEVASAE